MTTLYLVLLTYVRPLEDVDAHLEEHRAFLARSYTQQRMITSGSQIPRKGGVIFARGASEEDVREWIAEDPFNQHGIAEYQVIPFEARWSVPELIERLGTSAPPIVS